MNFIEVLVGCYHVSRCCMQCSWSYTRDWRRAPVDGHAIARFRPTGLSRANAAVTREPHARSDQIANVPMLSHLYPGKRGSSSRAETTVSDTSVVTGQPARHAQLLTSETRVKHEDLSHYHSIILFKFIFARYAILVETEADLLNLRLAEKS